MRVATRPRLSERVNACVRAAVEVREMTPQDLADVSGLPLGRVENRLSGLAPWSIDELWAVAWAMEVPVPEFVDWFAD